MAQEEMTVKDWEDAGYRMVWCIYDPESERKFKEKWTEHTEEYDKILLDMSSPAGTPDGTHVVRQSGFCNGEIRTERVMGVEVSGGRFVPGPTDQAIFEAACRSYGLNPLEVQEERQSLNHVFIEEINWTRQPTSSS